MNYIKTFEQYTTVPEHPDPTQEVLRFIANKNEGCSLDELLGNFPDEQKTRSSLAKLSEFIEEEDGKYKVNGFGAEKAKLIKQFNSN